MNIMRETTWFPESKEKMEMIAHQLYNKKTHPLTVKIKGPKEVHLKIYTDSYKHLKLTKEMFLEGADSKIQAQLYFVSIKDKTILKKFGYDVDHVNTSCIGLYDSLTHTALTVGGDEFGLLKSIIIGLASTIFQPEYHPVHGAAFQYAGRNILMLGHHGAGKTTTLLHLFHYDTTGQIKILTDDWSIWTNHNKNIKGIAMEKNISFKEDFAEEYPYLNLGELFDLNRKNAAKIYISPNELYGENTSLEEMGVDIVMILDQRSSGRLIKKVALNKVISLLVDSTYHMPDTNRKLKKADYDFWQKNLQDKILVSLDSRPHLPMRKDSEIIKKFILRSRN